MVLFQQMKALLIMIIVLFSGMESRADIYKYISDEGTVYFTNTPVNGSPDVVIKERKSVQGQAPALYRPVVRKEDFHVLAEKKAGEHNIDPNLIKAVIKTESNWNAGAVSRKGALGLMQLMPSTAFEMGVNNPFDPAENIEGGIKYLKYLLQKFNGNLTLALAAYNAGPKNVEKRWTVPAIPETVAYVKRVKSYYSGDRAGDSVNPVKTVVAKKAEREVDRIKKMVLNDGTILFTNSYLAGSYFGNN
ncbi:MAG: transglycosylase SLT domain-containing protein [Deltaproteobacteria bacterium]|nr:transglycosylase SLT domain-containing protein [Deltaproteobacteria bacterium]